MLSSPILQPHAHAVSRQREAYETVRKATLALSRPLSEADCTVQSMPDASLVKWHLAHTSWFFETFVLTPHWVGYPLFNPAFKVLFNSYYHAVGERHPRAERGQITRPPGLQEVLAYRAHVDAAMGRLLSEALPQDVAALVELGCHHEQQHQESLARVHPAWRGAGGAACACVSCEFLRGGGLRTLGGRAIADRG